MSEFKPQRGSDTSAAALADDEGAPSLSVRTEWMRQVHLVRKQEFSYLRSVLKREGGEASERTLAGMPVRAPTAGKIRGDTLKKIDEIEAQLDLLWLASRGKRSVSEFSSRSGLAGASLLLESPGLTTISQLSALPAMSGVLTQIMHHAEMPNSVLLTAAVDSHFAPPELAPVASTVATKPKTPGLSDAALSTAATLFASADYDRAAQHLLRALRDPGERAVQLQRLLALLDIYRATGNQAQFDWSVLEYFDHWDGGTPQWHTSPMVRVNVGKASPEAPPENARFAVSSLDDARVWRCPSLLNLAAARKLRAHWLASRHCGVDWTSLSTLDATASAELVACFTQAQGAPSQLIFVDTPNLLCVLEQATPQGQPQVARSLWELRFCLLELMQMRAAFDAAATDFCLTYIEPAPTWKTSKIHFIGDARTPAPLPAEAIQGSPWHLSGHVLGATGLGLPDLPEHPAPQRITVACAALVRMDAEAIAQLLTWLRSASEKKADVHLQGVGVLVGAAWAAAGIDALAQVHLRDLG